MLSFHLLWLAIAEGAAEVGKKRVAITVRRHPDEDILRLDVTMNDLQAVKHG